MKTAHFGSISHATMRAYDLIPTFCIELRELGHRSIELTRIERIWIRKDENNPYFTSEESMWDLETLFDMLQQHAPELAYFGSHPGDGSDYGFWVSDMLEYDFDGLKVDDTDEIPAGYKGLVLHVNDHGNMTLYNKTARKLIELWTIV